MKKPIILVIIGILMSTVLFAEEPLAYRVTATSEAYKQTRGDWNTTLITLHEGDIVYSDKKARRVYIRDTGNYIFMMYLAGSNAGYGMHVKNLFPVNTENVFGEEIFIDYPPDIDGDYPFIDVGDVKEMWVPSYYCYVLKSEDRNTLLEFNPTLKVLNAIMGGVEIHWYEEHQSDIKNGRCMFYNAAINIGLSSHFLVKNIKKTEYGYAVNCVESVTNNEGEYRRYYQAFDSVFWDKYKPGDEMTLYLYLDGDYMDIYVDGKDLFLGTIVKVKKEFIEEYQSLIRYNVCDLSRLKSWYSRADGSTDYPPPELSADNTIWVEDKMPESAIEKKAVIQNNDEESSLPPWALVAIVGGAAVVIGGGAVVFVVLRKK